MANKQQLEILNRGVRHWNEWREREPEVLPNLMGAILNNAELSNINLSHSDLGKSDLSHSSLQGADLSNADLRGADLSGANLMNAELDYANLNNANLQEIKLNNGTLIEATLYGAELIGADLSEADLTNSDIRNADLSNAILKNAILPDSKLNLSKLIKAHLYGANLRGANLNKANLYEAQMQEADLRNSNLAQANLTSAYLRGADLSDAEMTSAILRQAIFSKAILMGAILEDADLSNGYFDYANFSRTNLRGADLSYAKLEGTNFEGADLDHADFSMAKLSRTIFAYNDLSTIKGLDFVEHWGPSGIGIETIYESKGKIPEVFLRGAGLPDNFITYMSSLTEQAFQFYSCFISYSSADQGFAERLHADLQSKGVRCWFAPEDMKIGDRICPSIDESIRVHDKLLLILSRHSVRSQWVEQEVETALAKERQQGRTILFPIRLDDEVMAIDSGWPALIRNTRHIGDFTGWDSYGLYHKSFNLRRVRQFRAACCASFAFPYPLDTSQLAAKEFHSFDARPNGSR